MGKIRLPIVEYKKNGWSKFIGYMCIFFFIGLICTQFIINLNLLNYFFIGGFVVFGLIAGFVKNDEVVGHLYLTEFYIQVENKKIMPLNEISELTFFITGYEGRKGLDNIRSFHADDGKNNSIEYTYHGTIYEHRFFISSKNYGNLLQIIKMWEINNIQIIKNW